MTNKQNSVLAYIKLRPAGVTPTEIGMGLGKPRCVASSWASGAIKALVSGGYIKRWKLDGRVFYKVAGK